MSKNKRCGFVAFIGRPNVGKSTLLNKILGKKLSITSRKPQTTRYSLNGIKTVDDVQTIYVDTPGLHRKTPRRVNQEMNRAATSSLPAVDLVMFVVDANKWNAGDEWALEKVSTLDVPVILVINKLDTVADKMKLLPHVSALTEKLNFADVVYVSAKTGKQVAELEQVIADYLPEKDFIFPPEKFTDKADDFLASEIIREKLMRALTEELPYTTAVVIEKMEWKPSVLHIHGLIQVESEGQKGIVIGKHGTLLKQIGIDARLDMEKLFNTKVFLKLWVKAK